MYVIGHDHISSQDVVPQLSAALDRPFRITRDFRVI